MFRKSTKANSSDEELNGRPSPFWKTRSSDDLTKADLENIAFVDRLLEKRLETSGPTRTEIIDNGAVSDHFDQQLMQAAPDQLEAVRASQREFWSDLNADRDTYMKQIAGVRGPSSNILEPNWTKVVLDRRGKEICSNKWRGVEVPNMDSQASPRFASLSSSGVKHVKQPVSTAEHGKEQVCIIEQPVPMVIKEGAKPGGLVLVGVCGAIGIRVAWKYSGQLSKSIKHLLKKWFGAD